MLTINKVRFKNFCQHRDSTYEFKTGLVGIVGRNGCGKSNLIKGILRCLVGETFNPGTKEDDITWSVDQQDVEAFIELTFTTNGDAWVLKRALKSSTVSLHPVSNPKNKTRSATEVKNKLFPMLNVHPRILTQIVFVLQGSIEGILFQIPSERAKSLQHLFQTHNAEKLRELFSDELNNVSLLSRETAIVELETRLKSTIIGPLDEARKTVSEFTPGMLDEGTIVRLKDLKSSYERSKSASAQTVRLKTELDAASVAYAKAKSESDYLSSHLHQQQLTLDSAKTSVEHARRLLQVDASFKAQAGERTWYEKEISVKKQLLRTPEPVVSLDAIKVETETHALRSAQDEWAQLKRMIDEFNTHKTTSCPLCGQEVPQTYLSQRLQRMNTLQHYIEHNDVLVARNKAQLKSMTDAHSSWNMQMSQAHADLSVLQQRLAQLPVLQSVDEAALREATDLVATYDQFQESYRIMKSELSAKSHVVTMCAGHVDSWQRQWEAAEAAASAVCSDAVYAQASESLGRHEQAALATAKAAGIIQTLEAQKADLESQVAKYREEEKKLVNQRKWKEWLERGKKLLHRDELPALVMRAYLEVLNKKLASYLEIFGSQFSAKLLPDTSVRCQFVSDNARQDVPSERLSGGQKVVLGIAFRFAVYDLFVRDLGLLVLDEPTVYLDKDNVHGVADLLERVKLYSQKSGMQLFVVTHEESLVTSFDQTIVLT